MLDLKEGHLGPIISSIKGQKSLDEGLVMSKGTKDVQPTSTEANALFKDLLTIIRNFNTKVDEIRVGTEADKKGKTEFTVEVEVFPKKETPAENRKAFQKETRLGKQMFKEVEANGWKVTDKKSPFHFEFTAVKEA